MKLCATCIYKDKSEYEKPCIIYQKDCNLYKEESNLMNEGRIAIVITDNCSRFFKGDHVQIIRYINANGKYLVRRVEGRIEGEVDPEDIQFEEDNT